MKMKFTFILISCFLAIAGFSQTVNISFQVDMSNSGLTPGVVSIGGGFQGWAPEAGAMTELGNGIWERTYAINSNSTIQFKFTAANDWSLVEQVPAECGVNDGFGNYNRTFQVGDTDATFGPVCFSSCISCEPIELIPVTFRVDMSNETVGPNGVHVYGSFQQWNPASSELLPIGLGIYEGTFGVVPNTTAYFKFINGNDWPEQENVPADCGVDDGFGGFNRFVEVGDSPTSHPEVCFNTCYACDESVPVLVNFQVDMSNEVIDPLGVFITGSFNDFDPAGVQMSPGLDNKYEASLILNPGIEIQYKFLNGPSFEGQETVPMECGIEDGFGAYNRSFTAAAIPETVPVVCFSACAACPSSETFMLTLNVDMNDEAISPDGVFIAGSFNDFNPSSHEMNETSAGIYSLSIEVSANEIVSYKFLNGPSFDFVESVPSGCGQPDGFGGYNRAILVDSEINADLVCFSSCSSCTVGITESSEMSVGVYPNPSAGIFNLSSDRVLNSVSVYDLNGRLIKEYSVMNRTTQLNLSDFEKGMYILQSEGIHPIKIIVE